MLWVWAVLLGCSAQQLDAEMDPRLGQTIRWSENFVDAWQVPGVAIGIVEHGELLWAGGLGTRQLGSALPVGADTRFRVGSLSKMFTVAAIAPLVQDGLLVDSAPIGDVLDGVLLADENSLNEITLHHLLSHSGGLQPSGLPNTCDVGPDALASIIAERSENWEQWADLEQFFLYGNTNYALAGHAAEQVTGETFATLVTENVLESVGMERSTYFMDVAMSDADYATGHSLDVQSGDVVTYHDFSTRYCGAAFPSGGLISTVNDLGRFAEVLLAGGGPGLSSESMAWMTTNGWDFSETSRYGYGIQVGAYNANPYLYHTGSLGGFQSLFWLFPEEQFGVIVLVNSDHFIDGVGAPWSKPTHRIAEYIVQTFLPEMQPQWRTPASLVDASLWEERYVGTYQSDQDWGEVHIVLEGEQLWMDIPGEDERRELLPYSSDVFSMPKVGSDGRLYYPVVSFVVEDGRTEWLISSGDGIARRVSG